MDSSHLPESATKRLDELLAECLRAPASSQDEVLERACEELPESAAELRHRFQLLRELGLGGLCADDTVAGAAEPRIFGDFELGELLGMGGMGVVHRARQLSLERDVVVKLIRPDLCHLPGTRERFRREAEAIARLQHPGIVPIYVVDEHEGVPFFAMAAVDGQSIAERLEELAGCAPESLGGKDLAPGLAGLDWVSACLAVTAQVADALEHAGRRGILHRDVKPSNVMLDIEGRAHLIDFGLHALIEAGTGGDRLTREGVAPGTLLYQAPEQLERGHYDTRSEVYALGAMLYELLALRPPFQGGSRSETERLIRKGGADALPLRNRKVRADVDAVVRKSLAPEPGRRYASLADFAADLRRLLAGEPVSARPDGALYRLRRWVTRQPALATASLAAALLAVSLPTVVILQQASHVRTMERAYLAEREAREESDDLAQVLADLLETASPELSTPNAAGLALLDPWEERVRDRLAKRPRRKAEMLSLLGRLHGFLGSFEKGRELLLEALGEYDRAAEDLSEDELPPLARERAEARVRLANMLETASMDTQVLKQMDPLIADLTLGYGESHWRTIAAKADRLRLLVSLGEEGAPSEEELDAAMRGALAALESAPDATPKLEARFTGWIGSMLVRRAMRASGDERRSIAEESVELLQRAREGLEQAGQGTSLEYATATNTLGMARKSLGDLEAAETCYRDVLSIYDERLQPDDVRIAVVHVNLAGLTEARGDLEGALEGYEKAHELFLASLGADAQYTVVVEGNRLGTLFRLDRLDGLAERYDELLPRQLAFYPADSAVIATSYQRRGIARATAGDATGARSDLEHALELLTARYGLDGAQVKETRSWLVGLSQD